MAGTITDKKTAIISLADEIRKSKAEKKKSTEAKVDVEELASLIEELKKKRKENTVANKVIKSVAGKVDKATNPTTYLKAVIPKMFKTFHENLETYDKERTASKELEKQQADARKAEVSAFTKSMKALIDNNEQLADIQKRYGQAAAQQAAINAEESKALMEAEKEYLKNMSKIDERLGKIDDDARAQWAKDKGIQLVKIVDDEPSTEALNEIKAKLSEQIEADANKYEEEKIRAKKVATDERRHKEGLIKEQSWFRKFWSKKDTDKKEQGGGLLANLLGAWLIEGLLPLLIKGGILAGLIAGLNKYFEDPEFRDKINEGFGKVWQMLKDFMSDYWKEILLALALLNPGSTLLLLGKAFGFLLEVLTGTGTGGALVTLFKSMAAALMGPLGVVAGLAALAGALTYWSATADINNPGMNPIANVGAAGKKFADWSNEATGYNAEIERRRENIRNGKHADGSEYKPEPAITDFTAVKKAKESVDHYQKMYDNAKTDAEKAQIKPALDAVIKNYETSKAKLEKNQASFEQNLKLPAVNTVQPVTPAFSKAMGTNPNAGAGNLTMNAPTVTTNNSSNQTFVMPKTAVDPSRSIMFQKP